MKEWLGDNNSIYIIVRCNHCDKLYRWPRYRKLHKDVTFFSQMEPKYMALKRMMGPNRLMEDRLRRLLNI